MLGWINEARAGEHLEPLTGDARLAEVAEAHSLDMASHNFFSHTSPTTGSPGDRAAQGQIAYRSLAENIALNRSVRAANDALFASPGHRSNLLDPALRRVGIGIVRGRDGFYVTQLFATLRDESVRPTPMPAASVPVTEPSPAQTQAPAAPTAPVAAAPTDEDEGDDEGEAPRDEVDAQPEPAALPPWVQQWVGPFLGTPNATPSAPTAAPSAPSAPRAERGSRAPAARAGRGQTQTVSIPTPFGPLVMQVPQELMPPPGAAAPQEPSDASSAPAAAGDEPTPRRRAATPARPAQATPAARGQVRTPYQAPRPMTTPGRVTTVDLPPVT